MWSVAWRGWLCACVVLLVAACGDEVAEGPEVDQGVAQDLGADLSTGDMAGPDLSSADMSDEDMLDEDMPGVEMGAGDMLVEDMSGEDMRVDGDMPFDMMEDMVEDMAADLDVDQMDMMEQMDMAPSRQVGFCQTETQTASVAAGQATGPLRGKVFVQGVTEAQGQGAGVSAELVWGPRGADPATWMNRAPAAYVGDATGLNPNAATNDRYEVRVTPAMQGDYDFVYRFSVDGGQTWSLCDTDGSDGTQAGFEAAEVGQLSVTAAPAQVGYCVTETAMTSALAGQQSAAINGVVYVAGATGGAGRGPGILGRILWGPANQPPSMWTSVQQAAYANDADGLGAGDMANDRYTAQLAPAMSGSYGYVYQFSVDGGQTWSSCDTDGSDGSAAGFEANKVGALAVSDTLRPDECRMQFPIMRNVAVGTQVQLYGRLRKAGLTDVGDNNPQVRAEAWVGGIGADVNDPNQWTKLTAQFNAASAGQPEDEYVATWTAPTSLNYRKIFYRFSLDAGATWTLCDIDGANGVANFNPEGFGAVNPWTFGVPNTPDYCHNFTGDIARSLSSPAIPDVTAEVYEPGLTEGNGGANSGQLFAQVGYGRPGSNPWSQSAFTWRFISYARVTPNAPNNYQYEGDVMTMADMPAPGTYDVVVRIRRADEGVGEGNYAYCDNLQASMDYSPAHVPKLTISP